MNCLNGEKWLAETLASVQAQTFQNFEIIFWDNNSTDKSMEIAQKFGPRLKLYKSPETVPLGKARNCAIARAQGEYIAFLDCDDLWKPDKLEKQLQLMQANSRLGLVCTDTEIFRGKSVLNRMFHDNPPARGMAFAELVQRQWISMSSAMLRKSALDQCCDNESGCFDERLNICEEADLFYRLAYYWELDFVNEALTAWRMHDRNTTFRKFEELARETRIILEKHKKLFPDYALKYADTMRLLENRANFQEALALWRKGEGKKARKLLNQIKPVSLKQRLFHFATFLPGTFFDLMSRLYFYLPGRFRH